jgi:uncharacterized phage protein gp47/JayE
MSEPWGLSEKGFMAKDFASIKADMEAALLRDVDPTLSFGTDTVIGQITKIVSFEARAVWEATMGLYHSLKPDSASGQALDALCSLTGTYRFMESRSKVKVFVTLDPQSTIPVGSAIATNTGDIFKNPTEIKNASNRKVDLEGVFVAKEAGKVNAHFNTFATIMTPCAGWSQAIFKETVEIGRNKETDDELRERRFKELKATGSATGDALKARLLQVPHVEAVFIREGAGQHNFEVVVKGGLDQEIAQTIWKCRPLGVGTNGTTPCKIKDLFGQERLVRFSRPEVIALTLEISLKVRESLDDKQILTLKKSLADYAVGNFKLGTEVYPARFYPAALGNALVLDILSTELLVRGTSNPMPTEIKAHQMASLGFDDITIIQTTEVFKNESDPGS